MLKIKTSPGQIRANKLIVIDCEDYPGPSENEWAIFLWLLERSVISDTLERCGKDPLTIVENNETVVQQKRFVNLLSLQEKCSLRLKVLSLSA